jgi:hypothetical protein
MNEINLNNLDNKILCLLDKYTAMANENIALRQQLANYENTVAKLEDLLAKIREKIS